LNAPRSSEKRPRGRQREREREEKVTLGLAWLPGIVLIIVFSKDPY
jgi:hypothetical protein